MAYILGTAGHVDHGKTSLIKKLTGIETMHLPEEKKRGMTIELGFAALETEALGTVGIVDVPGHERFIRNMVAGTWGLDAALLVIAADDGWMQMTTDHLRVLKAMHIDSILAVISKSDLADADTSKLPNGGVYNSFNFAVFGYANNNPVKYMDPTGESPALAVAIPAAGKTVGAVAMSIGPIGWARKNENCK